MHAKDETMVMFYQVLGRVFYAAAQSDKVIKEEEVEAMKKVVRDVWVDVDETFDEFNSDSAYQIEIVFDYLLNNEIVIDDVMYELKEFKKTHTSLFTNKINELIMSTANKITSSFAQRNKSELVFLSQLQLMLNK